MADTSDDAASTSSKSIMHKVCKTCGTSNDNEGGALLRCGSCKAVSYCSKDCQKSDWPNHKRYCKSLLRAIQLPGYQYIKRHLPNNARDLANVSQAFVIYMIQKGPQVEIQIAACVLGDKKGADALFAELPVSRALGFPLGIAKQPIKGLQVPNIGAEILSIDPDPKSLTFGQCLPAYQGTGGLIVARCDGKPLHGLHVEALLHYVQHVVWPELDAMEQREKAGEVIDRQEVKDQLLTPAAFATGFRTFKEIQMAWVDDSERDEL
ncbi:hypothetical protein LTR97_001910 [Elasticomyces elasticus]|uniref:MYND-type domain-containing protein n=1 Tax=Elasticomyces elasticus TaxID=574655 RepID=A0AAN7VWT7_9PEZI|nr:hypothetical protein LTR97_001910 [Elasticomyces elasticus]